MCVSSCQHFLTTLAMTNQKAIKEADSKGGKFLELAGQCSNDGVIRRLFLDLRMSVHQQYGASDGLGDAAAQTRQASSPIPHAARGE